MKHLVTALTAGLALGLGSSAFGVQTHAELIKHREEAVREWKRTLEYLKKGGMKEDDPAYKRVHKAFAWNESNLKTLRSGKGKTGKIAATAAGAGALSKLGGLFGGRTQETAKAKPTTAAAPKSPTVGKKSHHVAHKRKAKKALPHQQVKKAKK